MPPQRGLQLQRFELKYLINERTALAARDFIRSHLEPDEFAAGQPGFCYPVHSVYLDSDDLVLYRQNQNGNPQRFKLRLRYYDAAETAPVFLEIKRRDNETILKLRAGIRPGAVLGVLAGQRPGPGDQVGAEADWPVAVDRFVRLLSQHQCGPKAYVFFQREAWVHPTNNSVRVTFDRSVRCAPLRGEWSRPHQAAGGPGVFGNRIVLELKFTNRFPIWFTELVRALDLERSSAAKYADGICLLGEERFNSGSWTRTAHGIAGVEA